MSLLERQIGCAMLHVVVAVVVFVDNVYTKAVIDWELECSSERKLSKGLHYLAPAAKEEYIAGPAAIIQLLHGLNPRTHDFRTHLEQVL